MSQEHETWLPRGRHTHGIKAFTNTRRDPFRRGAPASPALWSGWQDARTDACIPKGRIRRTNGNICAGSLAAHPHQSGRMTPGSLKVQRRVALCPNGLGSPPRCLPRGRQCRGCPAASQHLFLQQPARCGCAAPEHGRRRCHGPSFVRCYRPR